MRNRNCARIVIVYSALMTVTGCGGSADESSNGTGGSISVGGAATGGLVAATGGKPSTGGAMAAGGIAASGGSGTGSIALTGGAKASVGGAGGSQATSDGGSQLAMCTDVCALLASRSPKLTCVPEDCEGTCNRTYDQLRGANTACADAYMAYYECGLTLSASEWDCLTIAQIDIPTPPSAGKCNREYQALLGVIMTNMVTCGAALSW